jgi:hypothetical protein
LSTGTLCVVEPEKMPDTVSPIAPDWEYPGKDSCLYAGIVVARSYTRWHKDVPRNRIVAFHF